MAKPFPGCLDSVHALNPRAIVCSDQHCTNFTQSETFHDGCNTFGEGHPLYPISTAQCINRSAPHDIVEPTVDPILGPCCPDGYATQMCYCCCSCLANGTPIAVPEGVKAIEQLRIGDDVTVGSWNASELSWSTGTVHFSSGSDAGWKSTMLFIELAGSRQLIASADHLFLLDNGKLKRADRLVPQQDKIMGADGLPVEVLSSHIGSWDKGLHHIATDLKFEGSLDGHLINSAGLVSGDYCLQINQHELIKMGLMDAPESSPAHGSKAFAAANPHLTVTRTAAFVAGETLSAVAMPEGFSAFNPNGDIYIPAGAAQFVTDNQAKDIVKNTNAVFRDLTHESGIDAVEYLFKVFKAFYPSIHFLIDRNNPNFNTYGFEMYGQQHLVISGEVTRLNGLYSEGLKFIIAQGIARLQGAKPQAPNGFSYTAAADFQAISAIFRQVFFIDSEDLFNNALDQMKTIFGYISPDNAAGNPNDLANDPSIKCRIGSINTGIFGGNVLPCACNDLALLSAATDAEDPLRLRLALKFNKGIDPLSVEDLYNFKFTRDGASTLATKLPKTLSAQVNPQDSTVVELTLKSPLDVPFTISLVDVWSEGGSVLSAHNNASFRFSISQ